MQKSKKILLTLFFILLAFTGSYLLFFSKKSFDLNKPVDQSDVRYSDQIRLIYISEKSLDAKEYASVLNKNQQVAAFVKELAAQNKNLQFKYTLKVCPNLKTIASKRAEKSRKIENDFRKYLFKKLELFSVFNLEKVKTKCAEIENIENSNIDHVLVIHKYNFKK